MTDISYIGESLLPGQVGHLLFIIAFVSSLLSAFAMYRAHHREEDQWYQLGARAFHVHGISILSAMVLMLFLMINKHYEYNYVWTHVNDELPFRYIFSAFWEGQEGSFLLWMFWHIILGWVVLRKKTPWTAGAIGVVALVEAFITSMLLGVHIFGYQLGVNPFALLRDVMDIPLFNNAQYLELIDGNGLNPLLQNYWMTIHPPTTFLGFASLTIPFAFAVSGLTKSNLDGWYKAVLPWGLFAGGMLGTGILMGAAWAYEALTFGGYWAWDPVENSSLVPWLIMVAGIHTNLIAKSVGRSRWMTFFFYAASFILIVYSTFLTRSGVLGDTSVHAFTEMGLELQLLLFLLFFTLWSGYLLITNYKRLKDTQEEEPAYSREFWMFIGSLILLFSSILILFTTSIPVYNKLFTFFGEIFGQNWDHLHRTAPVDPVAHYNKYQLWIAVLMSFVSVIAIYLRYAGINWKSHRKTFWTRMALYIGITLVTSFLIGQLLNVNHWTYGVLLGASIFTLVGHLDYVIRFTRLNLQSASSTLAHAGFGIMVLGILFSGLNKEHISTNRFAQEGLVSGLEGDRLNKNIYLIKGAPMFMNNYWVTYVRDTMEGNIRKYTVHYRQVDSTGQKVEDFVLTPQVVYNNKVTKVASVNPATKHYPHKDIFTHISAIPPQLTDIEEAQKIEDTLTYQLKSIRLGDTFEIKKGITGVISGINDNPSHEDYIPEPFDIAMGVQVKILNDFGMDTLMAEPIIVLRGNLVYRYSDQINEIKTRFDLDEGVFDSSKYEEKLEFIDYQVKLGDLFTHEDYSVQLMGFTDQFAHPGYEAKDGDIAVAADILIKKDQYQKVLQPVFVIRDNRTFSLNAFDAIEGIHTKLEQIDPKSENVTLQIASGVGIAQSSIPLKVAPHVPRTDYIVMEAIIFPGINMFWVGSVGMMIGLFLGMYHRRNKNT